MNGKKNDVDCKRVSKANCEQREQFAFQNGRNANSSTRGISSLTLSLTALFCRSNNNNNNNEQTHVGDFSD
jgi:hypothetical protein